MSRLCYVCDWLDTARWAEKQCSIETNTAILNRLACAVSRQVYQHVPLLFDTCSGVVWKYQLFYYPETKEVEVCLMNSKRNMLILSQTARTSPSMFAWLHSTHVKFAVCTSSNCAACAFETLTADGGHQEQEALLEEGVQVFLCILATEELKNTSWIVAAHVVTASHFCPCRHCIVMFSSRTCCRSGRLKTSRRSSFT
jgi:intracellular sulfur oxidation DsrE/DsrF family protein